MSSALGIARSGRTVVIRSGLFACALLFAGCASKLVTEPVELALAAPGAEASTLRLSYSVDVRLDSGYSRTLRAGTTWKRIGSIPEGEVWEPVDTVLTVEGRYLHEAYLVVNERQLVGFYLPVADAFLRLREAIFLKFTTS